MVKFILDTGAQANVIPLETLKMAAYKADPTIEPTNVVLSAFGESKIQPLGTSVVPCNLKGEECINFSCTNYDIIDIKLTEVLRLTV